MADLEMSHPRISRIMQVYRISVNATNPRFAVFAVAWRLYHAISWRRRNSMFGIEMTDQVFFLNSSMRAKFECRAREL